MARTFKRRESMTALTEINVTPLIDLAFALLIIFMITTPLLEQSIEINLPIESAHGQSATSVDFQTISIDADGQLHWGSEAITQEHLSTRLGLLAKRSDPPVISIRAEATLPYQKVIDVIDLIKRNKLTKISLDTQAR